MNWHTVRIREKLIMIKACQMKHWDENIEKAKACMQCLKMIEKKCYDQIKNLIKQSFKKNLILFYDSKFKILHSVKLKFCWNKLYWVCKVIEKKNTYFLEKLNEILFRENFYKNWLKKFWIRNENFYISMSFEKKNNRSTNLISSNNTRIYW